MLTKAKYLRCCKHENSDLVRNCHTFLLSQLFSLAEVPPTHPPVSAAGWTAPVKKNMRAFQSDQELAAYLRLLAERHERRQPVKTRSWQRLRHRQRVSCRHGRCQIGWSGVNHQRQHAAWMKAASSSCTAIIWSCSAEADCSPWHRATH